MFKKYKNFYTDIYSFFILKKKTHKKKIENIYRLLRVDNTFKTTTYNRMFDITQANTNLGFGVKKKAMARKTKSLMLKQMAAQDSLRGFLETSRNIAGYHQSVISFDYYNLRQI